MKNSKRNRIIKKKQKPVGKSKYEKKLIQQGRRQTKEKEKSK